jgi:hypothetical protein
MRIPRSYPDHRIYDVVSPTLTILRGQGFCNVKTSQRLESQSNVDRGSKDPSGPLSTIHHKGHLAPDPILHRLNTLEEIRCKRLKTPEVVGSRRRSELSINRDVCQYIVNSERRSTLEEMK